MTSLLLQDKETCGWASKTDATAQIQARSVPTLYIGLRHNYIQYFTGIPHRH